MSALSILLVEDNPGDVYLIGEALRRQGLDFELLVAEDGARALRELEKVRQGQAKAPDLILLDLNVPKKNGLEVLRHIRADPACARTPVAILTSSDYPREKVEALDLGASCFIRKPTDLDDYMKVGATLKELFASELGAR